VNTDLKIRSTIQKIFINIYGVEYKIISIRVPVDAEIFDDTFTPEENYAILKSGREYIIKQRIENRENRDIRKKNRQKYRERLQELEKQIETMKRELQKYGVIFIQTTCQ
jgi:hypothetical protein